MDGRVNAYGSADASYKAAGQLAGISQLVDDFYSHIEKLPEAYEIRQMHGDDLTESRQKLSYFLSGWLLCMQQAIARQPYDEPFKTYLLAQLRIPAERIRLGNEQRQQQN